MSERWFDRFALWLERFTWLHPLLLARPVPAPAGRRYVNRLNGHLVVKEPR